MEVQLVDTPVALPGKCIYCGGSSKELYLDTGIQIEFYGAVYICNECMPYLASKFGYITPERAQDLLEKNKYLTHENQELEFKVTALEQAINSLKAAGFDERNSNSSVSDTGFSITNFSQGPLDVVESLEQREEELADGERTVVESFDDKGMAELFTGEPDDGSNPFELS